MRARTIALDVVLVIVLSTTAGACASPRRARVLGEQITRSTSTVPGPPTGTVSPGDNAGAGAGAGSSVSTGGPAAPSPTVTAPAPTTSTTVAAKRATTTTTAKAAVTTGTITGTVGRSGVTLTLYTGSIAGQSVTSAADGTFVFTAVKAGSYDLVSSVGGTGITCDTTGVCLADPVTYAKTPVVVVAGQTVTVNPQII